MIRILAIIGLLLLSNRFYGQTAQVGKENVLAVDILTKKTIMVGDTISVRIRNLSSSNRGFTIEAVSLNKDPYYDNAVYSAFFNNDSLFFHKLKASKEASKKTGVSYILPDYELHPYKIEGNSEILLSFKAMGKPIQKRVPIKLRITTDIISDESETIYSDPLYYLFVPF